MAYRRRFGSTLGEQTRGKIAKGYGRWLSFLDERYPAALTEKPAERITVPRLRAYYRILERMRNAPGTICGRFYELQAALRLIAPDFDGSVIRKLDGATMRQRLDVTPHAVFVPSIEDLMDWGLSMMQSADQRSSPRGRLIAFRDGLLITLLAARGRRRRSMTAIGVGRELIRHDGAYVVNLAPAQVKTAKADSFTLPAELTPYLDRYLNEVRPKLIGQRPDHGALWATDAGMPMSEHYMTNRMLTISRRRFGHAFGPHRFRHAISTALAYHAPEATGLAAAVLSISPEVVAGHYNRANQVLAHEAFNDVLAKRKRQLL